MPVASNPVTDPKAEQRPNPKAPQGQRQRMPGQSVNIPGLKVLKGKASVFGGPGESQGMASGRSSMNGQSEISVNIRHYDNGDGYDNLNGYWLLRAPNGTTRMHRQGDRGPNAGIDREFDLTPSAAEAHGYSYSGFPTDQGEWTGVYLGTSNAGEASRRASQIAASGTSLGDLLGAIPPGFGPLGGVPGDQGIGGTVDAVKTAAGAFYDVMKWLFGKDARSHWIRMGAVLAGLFIVGVGLFALANTLSGGKLWSAAKDTAKTAAEVAVVK